MSLVEDSIQKFQLSMQVEGLDKKTIDTYVKYSTEFVQSLNGKNINEITVDDILNYMVRYQDKSHALNNVVKASLRKLLSFYDLDRLNKNIKLKRLNIKIIEIPTQKEIINLIKKMPENNLKSLKEKIIVITIYGSGLRLNEFRLLKKENILPNKNKIFVPQEIAKFNKEREIILIEDLVFNYLNNYFKRRKDKSEYVIVNRKGKVLSEKTIENIIKKWAIKSKTNKRITPHILRKCYYTHNRENGVPEEILMRNMGHTTTEIGKTSYSFPEIEKIKLSIKRNLFSDLNERK